MPLLDYECSECGFVVNDVLIPKEVVPTCPNCDIMMDEAGSRSFTGRVEGGTGGGAGAGIVQKMPQIERKGNNE